MIGVQTPANLPLVQADSRGGARIEVLNNWLAPAELQPYGIDLTVGPLAGRTIFVYAGNMGAAQGMDCLIELATKMRNYSTVGFLFVGRDSEVPRLRALVAARGLDHTRIGPHDVYGRDRFEPHPGPACAVPRRPDRAGSASHHPQHSGQAVVPSACRAAGLPVLARVNWGNDLEGLIRSERVGYVVAGEAPARLHAYAELLADQRGARAVMADRCRALAVRMFSPSSVARQVIAGLAAGRE